MMHEISTYSYLISTICYIVAIFCFMATAFILKKRLDNLSDYLNFQIHTINKTMEMIMDAKIEPFLSDFRNIGNKKNSQ